MCVNVFKSIMQLIFIVCNRGEVLQRQLEYGSQSVPCWSPKGVCRLLLYDISKTHDEV